MQFEDLAAFSEVHLYAGDLPDIPQYRNGKQVGLSLDADDERHIRHNVCLPLPLADSSVDSYQSEDVFEHIELASIPLILNDIYRVLKKGALFRLSLPDYRCDILYERSIKDKKGELLFDPCGGGRLKRRFKFFGKAMVVGGGHVWFPKYETVQMLMSASDFTSFEFLHYYDENNTPHTRQIDYNKGFVQRTPDNDARAASPYRPMSIVVDAVK